LRWKNRNSEFIIIIIIIIKFTLNCQPLFYFYFPLKILPSLSKEGKKDKKEKKERKKRHI